MGGSNGKPAVDSLLDTKSSFTVNVSKLFTRLRKSRQKVFPVGIGRLPNDIMMTNDFLSDPMARTNDSDDDTTTHVDYYAKSLMSSYQYDISLKETKFRENRLKDNKIVKYEVSSINPVGIFENPEYHAHEMEAALRNVETHKATVVRRNLGIKAMQNRNPVQPFLMNAAGIGLKFHV